MADEKEKKNLDDLSKKAGSSSMSGGSTTAENESQGEGKSSSHNQGSYGQDSKNAFGVKYGYSDKFEWNVESSSEDEFEIPEAKIELSEKTRCSAVDWAQEKLQGCKSSNDDYDDEVDSDSDSEFDTNMEGLKDVLRKKKTKDTADVNESEIETGESLEGEVGSSSSGFKRNNEGLKGTDGGKLKSEEKGTVNRFVHYTFPGQMCVESLDEKVFRVRINDGMGSLTQKLHDLRHICNRKTEEFKAQSDDKELNLMQNGYTQSKEDCGNIKLLLNHLSEIEDEIFTLQFSFIILMKMKLDAIRKLHNCLKSELEPLKLSNCEDLGVVEYFENKISGLPQLGDYEATGEAVLMEDVKKSKILNFEGKFPANAMAKINLADSDMAANDRKMVKSIAAKGKNLKEQQVLRGFKILWPIFVASAGALAAVIFLFAQAQEN